MKKAYLIILFSLLTTGVWAKPEHVVFGVYPVSIYDVDPANGTFSISFYAWWQTTNKDYNPNKNIEILNARDYNTKYGGVNKAKGQYTTYMHYYAKIHQPWDSKNFPFGRQFLTVKMEPSLNINQLIFDPDYERSKLHTEFSIPGWKIIGMSLVPTIAHYGADFGNGDTFSRLNFIIEVEREGWRLYISYFIGFFMAGILVHILYLMNTVPFPARATVFIGGIIAFIGNKYTIDQKLPPNSSYGLADAIQIATFIVIIISILTSIYVELGYEDTKKRIKASLTIGAISLFCYVLYIVIYTWKAIVS